jgi:hypothetical protein
MLMASFILLIKTLKRELPKGSSPRTQRMALVLSLSHIISDVAQSESLSLRSSKLDGHNPVFLHLEGEGSLW